MKALITGITGFAGTYLAEHLLAASDEVLGSCRSGSWPASNVPREVRDVELIDWDLQQDDATHTVGEVAAFEPDCIYHLAAISVPKQCGEKEPTDVAQAINIGGTQAVVDLAASLPSRPRVVLVSSSYVYSPVDGRDPVVDETSPTEPVTAYGKTKLAAEQLAIQGCEDLDVDVVIARAFQHTGPRQKPQMMLPEWARQFARGDNPIRVVTLDSYIDITDVRDVVRAYRLLALRGQRGEVYNVGSGICRRCGDVFNMLRKRFAPDCKALQTSPGTRYQPIADISKLMTHTGWLPEIRIEKTLEDTMEFWRTEIAK